MNLGYLAATAIFAVLFLIAVGAQIGAKRFHPLLYWTTIIATTTHKSRRWQGIDEADDSQAPSD
jgi:uncharacterized membrane-anchored protein